MVGHSYIKSIPTAGNDLVLIGALAATGLGLGYLNGRLTHLRRGDDGTPLAKASAAAAVLWVAGVGARMAFAYVAQHGAGHAIASFSAAHGITGAAAWTDALVLMALGEVVARVVTLQLRARRISSVFQPLAPRTVA
jgi:hypothetical protein